MPAASAEPCKKRYEVKNWKQYNEALVNRGDFTFWFSEDVVDAWEHENEAKKNGRPFTYSDVAIETVVFKKNVPSNRPANVGRFSHLGDR